MTCRKTNEVIGCYVNAAGDRQNVIVHNVSDSDGAVIATLYLDQSHMPVDGADETNVKLGSCDFASPPAPILEMQCETVNDEVVYFWCVTAFSYMPDGTLITPPTLSYLTLDKTAEYTPVGTPEKCSECQPIDDAGVLNDWALLRSV